MNYHQKVYPIVKQVRNILMPHYGFAKSLYQKEVSQATVVTKLDIKVEKFLKKELKKVYPEIDFVGEETGGNRQANTFWLVDPIDGTNLFMRGIPMCSTMIALIQNGQPIYSLIYDFVSHTAYWAEKGQGAYQNKKRIYVSQRSLKESYMGYESHIEKKNNMVKYLLLRKKAVLVKTVSAGWEFAMTACGKLDGRISYDPYGNDYDFVPGALLVAEAGGVVVNPGSDKYDFRNTNIIATNKIIYKELVKSRYFV